MNKKSMLICEACGDCFSTGDVNEQYIKRNGLCKSCFNYFDGFQKWLIEGGLNMENLKRLRKVLEDNFNIEADIDERGDRVEGASEYVIALVIAPHDGNGNRWMLRMTPVDSFDRWANSAHLELFFREIDDLITFLEQEKAYIWEDLFKCLSGEYYELRDAYGKVSADYDALYYEKQNGNKED